LLKKAKTSKGHVLIIADEIDTVLNEIKVRDPAKLSQSHLINVCDCSMPEIGKELAGRENITAAPKVILTLGDQPSEVLKYSGKGESYRLDPVCGDITDALNQDRRMKKLDRRGCAALLAARYCVLARQTQIGTPSP